jgi:hypothetical protein
MHFIAAEKTLSNDGKFRKISNLCRNTFLPNVERRKNWFKRQQRASELVSVEFSFGLLFLLF